MENIVVKVEPPDVFDGDSDQMLEPSSSNILDGEMSNEMDYDSLGEFCFESDHPALRNNSDYKRLLQAIAVLEAQRSKAIRDLDRLNELQEEALSDPIAFVERLQRKEKIDVPGPQQIHTVPVIDWAKYSLSGSSSAFGRRQLTRLSTKATQDLLKNNLKAKANSKDQKQNKVSNFWTAEEQKRLEELLVQFPPEDVESRRWEKIANCLENRTPIQVASRVQKYFIKLMKAGIPIPGRMPSMTYLRKPRRNVIRQQPSTFLISHTLPVYMPEGENELNYSYYQPQSADENSMESRTEISDDEEIDPDLKDTPEFKELMLLKKVQREKIQTCGLTQHIGFKCCYCKTEPIIGIRWHCTDCKPPISIDFCEDCVESEYEIGQHTSSHKLEEMHFASSGSHDRDYTNFLGSDYNYLDPNYLPAS